MIPALDPAAKAASLAIEFLAELRLRGFEGDKVRRISTTSSSRASTGLHGT